MTNPVAFLSSGMTHGAVPLTGSPDIAVNGQPVLRLGDMVRCPIAGHGINPIITVFPTQESDGKPIATVTAVAQCGAIIITGSPDVYAG